MSDIQRVLKVIKWLIYNDFAENDRDLAAKLGYNITYFSQIKSGKAKISEQFVEKLCEADENLNKIWVINGEGEMLKQISQNLENVKNSVTIGRDANDSEIHVTCQNVEDFMNITKKHQEQIDRMLSVIEQLINK